MNANIDQRERVIPGAIPGSAALYACASCIFSFAAAIAYEILAEPRGWPPLEIGIAATAFWLWMNLWVVGIFVEVLAGGRVKLTPVELDSPFQLVPNERKGCLVGTLIGAVVMNVVIAISIHWGPEIMELLYGGTLWSLFKAL